jgi:hypothetical protein
MELPHSYSRHRPDTPGHDESKPQARRATSYEHTPWLVRAIFAGKGHPA